MSFLSDKYKNAGIICHWFVGVIILCVSCFLVLIVFKIRANPTSVASLKTAAPHSLITNNLKDKIGSSSYLNRFIYNRNDTISGDSWRPMVYALEYVKRSPGTSVYDVLFKKSIKFQYPLTSLLIFDLPQKMVGVSYGLIVYWLNIISFLSTFAIGLITARILIIILKQEQFEKLKITLPGDPFLLYFLVLLLTFLFYPILKAYKLGQIQTILTLLTALAILFWQTNKKVLAGVILGIICLIKPQLALLFFWGIIRRQWKMVMAGGVVIAIFLMISIALYGLNTNLYYLQTLSFLSRHGEAYYANQSVNGLMNRMLFNGKNTVWDGTFPPYSPLIYLITLITSIALMLAGLLWNYKSKNPNILDLCIMILCTTMASPIAWEHHYGTLLTIFVILSPFACYYYAQKKQVLFLLAFGYLLTSQFFEFTKSLANTNFNILQSYLFFGACVILFFLFKVSWKVNRSNVKLL